MPLKVLSTLAVKTALTRELLAPFTSETGVIPDIDWSPTSVLMNNIAGGARADVAIVIDAPMADLVARGIVVADSVRPLATAGIGIAVKAGAVQPDISTAEALKKALVSARSVALSQSGASGIYFASLLQRLGIADAVNAKATFIPDGFTASKIITGEADLSVQQISELMTIDGVDIVGPLPANIQLPTDFSVGLFRDSRNMPEAQKFIDHLTSKAADDAYKRGGLTSRLAF